MPIVPIKNPRELFLLMLSELRQSTERTTELFDEIRQMAQDPDIKEALEARVFVSQKTLSTLDQCFKLIGEQPVKLSGRVYEVFAEDFRREVAEMQNPTARNLFILARASQVVHLQIAEYHALVSAADLSGHYGVGVLLESCLADKVAFVERTRRFIRAIVETRVAEKLLQDRLRRRAFSNLTTNLCIGGVY
jgi:ferritin-like metal-binding protein YciE